MRFDIVTVFPRMIEAGLSEGVVHRGIERGLVHGRVHDLRDFTTDRHRSVDDAPYGGGPGMVMKVEPFVRAAAAIEAASGAPKAVVLLSPQGRSVRPRRRPGGWRAWGTWRCCAGATRGSTNGCGTWSRPRNCRSATTC